MRTTDDNVKGSVMGKERKERIESAPNDREGIGDPKPVVIDSPRPPTKPEPASLPDRPPQPGRPAGPAPAGGRGSGGRARLPTWPPLVSEI